MTLTGAVALSAFRLSRDARGERKELEPTRRGRKEVSVSAQPPGHRRVILLVAFVSGFGILALEVVWTRMFVQVLENSVYTFTAILVIVLLCLAAGALISSWLARRVGSPFFLLGVLIVLSGIAVAVTPFVFMRLTGSMQILAVRCSWPRYVELIFKTGFLTIGPAALLLGTVFPFLMKTEERHAVSAGQSLGRLSGVNTIGAFLGSVACGFLFLETLGMWRTMQLLCVLYLGTALLLPLGWNVRGMVVKAVGVISLLLVFTKLDPSRLPITSTDPLRPSQKLLEAWEGSDCTVVVVSDRNGRSIKINSHYGLGSTGAVASQHLQADIPLMVYPQTKSIFFLGLGTGITAGSSLDSQFSNVTRVVACELVPEVITAAKKYIANVDGDDYTGGLFTDPRATVIAEDGRHYLMATREQFDIINADLFVPFRSGAGSLYSKEHFQNVKARLKPSGVFVQWLPLYQVTRYEFSVIVRTMVEVFDQVSLWRNNFQPGGEVVALVGHQAGSPLPACTLDTRAARQVAIAGKDYRDLGNLQLPFDPQTILFFYCGNLTAAKELFASYPVNTDDKPIIEYMAPRSYRSLPDTQIPWFVGPRLARLVDEVQKICPPDRDPLLVNRTTDDRRLPLAGSAFYWAHLWQVMGNEAECQAAWTRFVAEWTDANGEVATKKK
jgi:spermidine synthase